LMKFWWIVFWNIINVWNRLIIKNWESLVFTEMKFLEKNGLSNDFLMILGFILICQTIFEQIRWENDRPMTLTIWYVGVGNSEFHEL
jgi:hypothetical protein